MDYLNTLAVQVEMAGKNLAYNLDFIPEDKLNWKPAPTANSTLKVVNHATSSLKSARNAITTGNMEPGEFSPATNVSEAKQLISSAASDYAQAMRALTPEDLNRTVELPFGAFPVAQLAGMMVFDLIHHHGQIAYIQTILGDTESHFDPSLFG